VHVPCPLSRSNHSYVYRRGVVTACNVPLKGIDCQYHDGNKSILRAIYIYIYAAGKYVHVSPGMPEKLETLHELYTLGSLSSMFSLLAKHLPHAWNSSKTRYHTVSPKVVAAQCITASVCSLHSRLLLLLSSGHLCQGR